MHKPPLILVVDDSPSDSLLLCKSLAKSGYKPVTANNGRDALRLAGEQNPDLILLDMTMPGMDGLECCRELRRQLSTAQTPIIFVTAHADSEVIVKAFAAGGSDYVTKPIRIDEILARLSVQRRLREAEENLVLRNQELESLTQQLAKTNETLARQSCIDGLTNLLNRRAWDEAAKREHERAMRYSRSYTVLMMDVDWFKAFNDSLGHVEGDRCLQQVAAVLARTCRNTDLVGRFGGEEFVVLATETSAKAGARLAERIRQGVWNLCIRHPKSPAGRVTVSIGVSDNQTGNVEDALKNADRFLYRAKNGGRNLVCGHRTGMLGGPAAIESAVGSGAEGNGGNAARPPTVLVVEDDRVNRLLYRGCLEKEGLRIVEVDNGAAAIDVIASDRPDLILMDVRMPVMDGIECTRRLKSDPEKCDLPIIMISAWDDGESVHAGFEAGADEYLTKPVRTTELMVRVRSMIRLNAERRDLQRSYELRAEQIRFLTLLVDFCRLVGDASTQEEVYDCLLATIAEITFSRRIMILAPGSDQKHLAVLRSIGLEDPAARKIKIPLAEGVIARVFATREAILRNIPDPVGEDSATTSVEHSPETPWLATTIGTSEQAMSVLLVTGRVGRQPFESRELEYVELVAGIAASALQTVQSRRAQDDARDMVVVALARLAEYRDSDTGRHVERVTQYSCILAETLRKMGCFSNTINDVFIRHLARAVPLHDVGKVAIPDRILLKPGKLTLAEMTVMRTHVDIGANTLRPLIAKVREADALKMALDVIRAHHEWYDGSGYPLGLQGDSIPLSARIVAVADVYDALTRDRVYKAAMSVEEAERTILQSAGTHFDPVVVEAFRHAKAKFRAIARRTKTKNKPDGEQAVLTSA